MKNRYSGSHLQMMAALKAAREKAGLTQRELAVRLQRSKNYVHYVETGATMLDVIEFMQYARACEADPYRLMRQFDPARQDGWKRKKRVS